MKKIIIFIYVLTACFAFQACKKTSGGDNDAITNVLPPYVQFASKAISAAPGDTVSVNFQMRSGLSQAVTVTYSVSGAVSIASQTVIIPMFTLSKTAQIIIPASITTATTATVTLVKATKADGSALTIGQDNIAANQKAIITITP